MVLVTVAGGRTPVTLEMFMSDAFAGLGWAHPILTKALETGVHTHVVNDTELDLRNYDIILQCGGRNGRLQILEQGSAIVPGEG